MTKPKMLTLDRALSRARVVGQYSEQTYDRQILAALYANYIATHAPTTPVPSKA